MNKEINIPRVPTNLKTPFRMYNVIQNWMFHFGFEIDSYISKNFKAEVLAEGVDKYDHVETIEIKFAMIAALTDYFKKNNYEFDPLNGLPPTRKNQYFAYEYSALWVWTFFMGLLQNKDVKITKTFYKDISKVVSTVFHKYPKITGYFIGELDLHLPGNQFLDIVKVEEAKWDDDHTDEVEDNEKADEFKKWILDNASNADEKDKMRVENWFKTKKSHKQIFSEIHRVSGNSSKFNRRLALFVERLFNQDGLDYFFEKTGFDSKEEMFLAYFEKLTMFDDEMKKSFIKKYLF